MTALFGDYDLAIAILKAAGAILGGVLGVAALFENFKGSDNRLTWGGWVVLSGICLSAIVGVSTSFVEESKSRSETREQLDRTERLLKEVDRSIQPITELDISYWIDIPSGDPDVDTYVKALDAYIEAHLSDLRAMRQADNGISVMSTGLDGEPMNISIDRTSSLWPKNFIAIPATIYPISLTFMREPIDPTKTIMISKNGSLDLSASSFIPERIVLDWDRKKKTLSYFGGATFDKRLWDANGKITSLVDLYGAQILIETPGSNDIFDNIKDLDLKRDKHYEAFLKSLNLRTMFIRFAPGREIKLSRSQLVRRFSRLGNVSYSTVFPRDEKAFTEFVNRSTDD